MKQRWETGWSLAGGAWARGRSADGVCAAGARRTLAARAGCRRRVRLHALAQPLPRSRRCTAVPVSLQPLVFLQLSWKE